ncbi:hypothetical protein BDV95DRAFT_497307 [Massariosphaeria phaeospora]|uniref:Rhodopsin domain-containing protein n=1 Tax=Massariosphaeria phaeospora TaxID=100035 RepID=A0A7C8M671_9PLEO|nr:hypothetical protein BDV95DRAFT_497307 [Massariosphaeria phaeospora]
MTNQFTPEDLAYMLTHKNESRVVDLYWILCSSIVLVVISTIFRLIAKKIVGHRIWVDDYLAIIATVSRASKGLGRHVLSVPRENIPILLQGVRLWSIVSAFTGLAVKLAVLAFHYRIFPLETFRKVVMGTAVVISVHQLTCAGILIFGCQSVQNPGKKGCYDLVTFGIANNIIYVLFDFWICLLPIPLVWSLKASVGKRLGISVVFALGLTSASLTIVRAADRSDRPNNFTWHMVPIQAYYNFEQVGGLLCTNIPLIARAIRQYRAKSSPSHSDNSGQPPSNSSAGIDQAKPIQGKRRPSWWLPGIDSIQLSTMRNTTRRGSELTNPAALATGHPQNQWNQIPESESERELTFFEPADTAGEKGGVKMGQVIPEPQPAQFFDAHENTRHTNSDDKGPTFYDEEIHIHGR